MPVIVPGEGDEPTPTPSSDRYGTAELVEETLGHLSGHTSDMGQVTWLTEGIESTDREFKVAELGQVSRGLAEIGNELIYVATTADGTCTTIPSGRGWGASTAQSWPEDTLVTFGPRFPRHSILNAINDVLSNIWPQLYGTGQTEFLFEPVVHTFELPAEAEKVTSVVWDPVGPQETWVPIDAYRFDRQAPTSEHPTGRTIDLPSWLTPGRTVRVRYMKRPSAIALEGDFLNSGLEESAWPAIMYGSLHRLAASLTLGQLGVDSAQSSEYARTRPLNSVEISQQYYALHVEFVNAERARLQSAEPIRINMTR